jgi:hypothetical protein
MSETVDVVVIGAALALGNQFSRNQFSRNQIAVQIAEIRCGTRDFDP